MIPKIDQLNVDFHLQQAKAHLDAALNQSVAVVSHDPRGQKEIAQKWETFLGDFFSSVREKGKINHMNLLGWISFPRLRKW